MAKQKTAKSGKRSKGKKPRSAAQKAATAKMLAANRAKKKHGGGGKKKPKTHHAASNPATGSFATASNPTKKKKKRKKNPSIPEPLMRAGSAVGQGFLGAGVTAGVVFLAQKFPAKSKTVAVLVQGGAAIVGGAVLGALGMPIAGTVVAAGLGGTALTTLTGPGSAAFTTGGSTPVQGLVEESSPIRGLVEAERKERQRIAGLVQGLVN